MRPTEGFVQESSKHQVKSEKQRTHSAVSTDARAVSTQEITHTQARDVCTPTGIRVGPSTSFIKLRAGALHPPGAPPDTGAPARHAIGRDHSLPTASQPARFTAGALAAPDGLGFADDRMKHAISTAAHGPFGPPMAEAVHACVHCGYCLPACPTYQVLGQEMDSPRGRIVLMKQVLEGTLPAAVAQPHLDACLGCLSCETACPSGVVYRDLISPYRALQEPARVRPWIERMKRFVLLQTVPYPARFRLAARLGRLAAPFTRLLPATFRPMMNMLPAALPPATRWKAVYRPAGPPRARVALHLGCVQQALDPEINDATISLLLRHGVEVVVPAGQECCGALGWHIGAADDARAQARQNLAAIPVSEVDAIISNAAGCGSGLREYPLILRGTQWESEARALAAKVRDICEFLVTLGPLDPPPRPAQPLTIAYQDACHLSHGQRVRSAPRQLLELIPGTTLCELPNPDICCGSAGTYNIDQPATAAILGQRKASAIAATHADFAASGNIGCLTQLRAHLPASFPPHRLLHTAVLLNRAWNGTLTAPTPQPVS